MKILKQWFNHPKLRELREVKQACARMTNVLNQVLESRFHGHCEVIAYDEARHILKIAAHDASVATQLRFQSAMLIPALRKRLNRPALQSIQVSVQVQTIANTKRPHRRANKPSQRGSQHIHRAADQCAHEGLKAALLRLAKHHTENR